MRRTKTCGCKTVGGGYGVTIFELFPLKSVENVAEFLYRTAVCVEVSPFPYGILKELTKSTQDACSLSHLTPCTFKA